MAMTPQDLVNFAKQYKAEKYEIHLDIGRWRQFNSAFALNWQKVKFDAAENPRVPKERGIYVFTLELSAYWS